MLTELQLEALANHLTRVADEIRSRLTEYPDRAVVMDGMQLVEDVLNSTEQLEEVLRKTESSPVDLSLPSERRGGRRRRARRK